MFVVMMTDDLGWGEGFGLPLQGCRWKSPLGFCKSLFSSSAFWNPFCVSRQLQGRVILRICKFPGLQELLCLSNGTSAPLSLEGTMGKVWENKNLKLGICFSEKSFSCKWQETQCKHTWAKRKLALLSKMSRGGSAFNGVWSKLRWCPKAWLLCASGWFSYRSGSYFLTLWWQERSSNSISPLPAACPLGNIASVSPRHPGEDAPYFAGSAKYFPLVLNVGGHGLAIVSMALLGSAGLPTMCLLIQAAGTAPMCERAGNWADPHNQFEAST